MADAAQTTASAEPRAVRWYYYDPTTLSSTVTATNSARTSPTPPTAPVAADPTLALMLASLDALQSQFATFRDSLGGVHLDLKGAIAQLQALRTAHAKTDRSIAELESLVGVDGASTASARSRTRVVTRGRGRKPGVTAADAPPDEEVGAADARPKKKTLVQSVAAIQATVEALFARDGRASDSHRLPEEALLPSTNPVRPTLPLPPIVDPSLSHLTVPPAHSTSATSSASQSELSSPLSSFVVPVQEPVTSPPPAVPAKEYADASTQACSTPSASEPSCSLVNAHRHVSGLVPVDWSVDSATHGRYAGNLVVVNPIDLVRPTAFTAEYLALFLRDAHLYSAPNSATDSQTPQSDLSPLSAKPVAGSLGAQRAGPASTPAQSSNLRAPSLATETEDGSMMPPQTGQPGGSQTLPASPLTPLSGSTRDTPNPKQLHAETDSEDTRMPSDAEDDSVSVPVGAKLAHATTFAVSDDRRASPVVVHEGGLPSGVSTSPSETVKETEPRITAATRLMTGQHDARIDPRLRLPPRLAANFPITSTQPSLTSESSAGEDRESLVGSGDADARLSELSSPGVQTPSTPPLFYPNLDDGELLAEEGARNVRGETAAHTGVQGHTCSLNQGDASEGASANVPATTPTNAPRAAGDVDASTTPKSSASQLDAELPPALDPDAYNTTGSVDSFPQNAYGYDIRFSSPLRRPSSSTTTTTPPSRYATPSESTDAMCLATTMQDEDELWRALLPGSGSGSEVPTPLSMGKALPPDEPPLLEQMFVNPSVLHNTPSLSVLPVDGHGPGCEEGGTSSPPILEESLSPLTSLGEIAAVDEESDRTDGAGTGADGTGADATQHDGGKTRTHISTPRKTARRGSGSYRGRRRQSELYHAGTPNVASAALEATMMRNGDGADFSPSRQIVGGPSASLDELMMLARREPLKIHLRIPERMRGVKRKRDENVGEGEGTRASNVDDECRQAAGARRGDTPPARTADTSALRTRTPTSAVSRLAPKGPTSDGEVAQASVPECSVSSGLVDTTGEHPDGPSGSPPSRKRTRKESERGKAYAQARQKKLKRGQEASPVTMNVRNGQLQRIPMPARRLEEEAARDTWTRAPTRMREENGQKNEVMMTPSSPQCPGRSSRRSPRRIKSSPRKEDVWDAISRSSRTWPQLPPTFDQWDCQFIQCDNCDKWYHYGCVGIKSGDLRLKPAILFICPICHAQSARRQTLRNQNDTCARPDCPDPHLTQDSGLFFIERLVGRKKTEGCVYTWLAKWEGYPMTEATWIPKENVVGDDERLFNIFIKNAHEEGADLCQEVVLLQEAVDAGWASET